jgi:signal transduction histidine kinase
LDRPAVKDFIRAGFKKNSNKDMVFFGKAANHHFAWLYVQLVNTTPAAKKAILEINSEHCDEVSAYALINNKPTLLGNVQRKTPLSGRYLPYFEFALPVDIPRQDTVYLLLQSKRYFGIHELSMEVTDANTHITKALYKNMLIFFQGVSFLAITLVTFILGFVFKRARMLFLSLFLFVASLAFAAHNQFFDVLPVARFFGGGNPGTIEIFFIFLTAAFFHPFGYQIIKPFLKVPGTYWKYARLIMGVNILFASMILLPAVPFKFFLPAIVYAFWTLTIINFIWIFLTSGWLYLNKGIAWYLLMWALGLLPVLVGLIIKTFSSQSNEPVILLSFDNSVLPFLTLAIIVIIQFTHELTHKKKAEENMYALQSSMEAMRKSEVEKIGRNLHDQVGNALASALGYLDSEKDYKEKAKEMIHAAITDLRFTSHNLVKDNDDPLTDKVSLLVSRFNDFSPVYFKYQDYSGGRINQLSFLRQQNIYSIIQELMSNIIRHAHAGEAYIQFFNAEDGFQVSVEDDGKGFNINEGTGIGLNNINKRATLSDFKLTIDSTANGTSVIIDIENN